MGDLSELLSKFGFDFDLDVELKNSLDQWQDQDIDTKAKQSSDIDQDNDNIGKVDYSPTQLAHNDASANNKAWTDVDTDNDSTVSSNTTSNGDSSAIDRQRRQWRHRQCRQPGRRSRDGWRHDWR